MNIITVDTPKSTGAICVSKAVLIYILLSVFILLFMSVAFGTFGILLIGLLGLCIVLTASSGAHIKAIKILPLIQIVFTVFMIALYYGLIMRYGEPYYAGDDVIFENTAEYLIQQNVWWFPDIPYIEGMFYAKGYALIISWMMRISSFFGGYHTVIPRVFNGFLWSAILLMISKQLPSLFWEEKKCRNLFAGFGIFPNVLYISGFVYRDTLVLFMLVTFYCSVREWTAHNTGLKKIWQVVKIILSLYLMLYLRSQLLYVMLAVGFIVLFWDKGVSIKSKWGRRAFIAFIAILILSVTGGMNLLLEMSFNYDAYRANEIGYGLSELIFSVPLFPFGIFLRFIWGLVSPFPGAILSLPYLKYPLLSLIQFSTYFGVIAQICIIPFLWEGLRKLDSKALTYLLVSISVVATTFTFRHLLLVYPFMLEVVADGLLRTHSNILKKMLTMLILVAVAGAVYAVI